MRFFLACIASPPLLQPLQSPTSSSPPKTQQHRNSIPGSELLERLLVVGVVGIDVASEPASRDGEGGALDGLLHEECPLGRAGERSGARASCAADEGGDGHCEGVVCGVGRSGDGRVGLLSFELLLCWAGRVAEVQTTTHWKLSGWRLGTVRESTCQHWSEGQETFRASPTIYCIFAFTMAMDI